MKIEVNAWRTLWWASYYLGNAERMFGCAVERELLFCRDVMKYYALTDEDLHIKVKFSERKHKNAHHVKLVDEDWNDVLIIDGTWTEDSSELLATIISEFPKYECYISIEVLS